jgi:hypothetical protein
MKTIQVAEATYAQTGESTKVNSLGMREMQAKAFEKRNAQYLLLKAPPASGKSRALMFLALDKLANQGIKKVIVAVPEKSIGGSFSETNLVESGFFADWKPNDHYNLCTPGLDNAKSKIEAFKNFMGNDEQILICTHATLRFACEQVEDKQFNDTLIAIDEIQNREVLLWSQFGQRVLLDAALQIRADNGNGGLLVMNGETTNITQDAAIARDLQVNRDTKVDHLLGGSDAVLTCVANVAGGFATATALGNDLAFDVTFTVAPSVTVNPGTKLATVTFARAFGIGLAPRFVASAKSGAFGAAAAFGAEPNGVDKCDVYWHGAALNGPLANLVCTVAILGKR